MAVKSSFGVSSVVRSCCFAPYIGAMNISGPYVCLLGTGCRKFFSAFLMYSFMEVLSVKTVQYQTKPRFTK